LRNYVIVLRTTGLARIRAQPKNAQLDAPLNRQSE